jgi:hypothetical protein
MGLERWCNFFKFKLKWGVEFGKFA